jgi:colanic acid/amylovoran biosynthesis glycosyltransferase
MKKVLFFIPSFPVVTETVILRDILYLQKSKKIDLVVFSLAPGSGDLPLELQSVTYYKNFDFFTFLKTFKLLFKFPINYYFLLKFDLFFILKSLYYASYISRFAPDEIHAHFLSKESTIALIVSKVLNIPISFNGHANDITSYPHLLEEKIRSSKFVSICNRNAYNYALKATSESKEKIHLINHSLDIESLLSIPYKRKSHKEPWIFVGGTRLVEKKGLMYLIEALKLLKDQNIIVHLFLLKKGPLFNLFSKKIKELNIENKISFIGTSEGAKFDELVYYYRNSDIFVFPNIKLSNGREDGIANVTIEAGIYSLPIITTDAGSNLEFLENNKSAIIVSQRSSKEIADAISYLLNNPEKARKLAENAHKTALKMFSPENTVQKLEMLLLK